MHCDVWRGLPGPIIPSALVRHRAWRQSGVRSWCILAFLLVAVVSASGCGDAGPATGGSPVSDASHEASEIPPQRLFSLLASPGRSFEVTFEWLHPYSGAKGYFVWRQGNGIRRWDVVQPEAGTADLGHFLVESDFSPSAALGDAGEGCEWIAGGSVPRGQASVSCSSSGWSSADFSALSVVLGSRVNERLPDETIARRRASCYSIDAPTFTKAVFCLDASDGIPVSFVATSAAAPHLSVEAHALSVTIAEQDLNALPVELDQEHPSAGIRMAEKIVPISTLQLPDLSEFGE